MGGKRGVYLVVPIDEKRLEDDWFAPHQDHSEEVRALINKTRIFN